MKKTTVFLMLIMCLTVVFPVNVGAKNSFDNNSYILANSKTTAKKKTIAKKKTTAKNSTTTTLTTSEYIAKSDVEKIVGTNSVICQEGSSLKAFFDEYWKIIVMVSPALVILMTSIDFFKAITSSDAERIKKSANDAFKRALAFVLLLFLPFIINTVFGWFGLDLCL